MKTIKIVKTETEDYAIPKTDLNSIKNMEECIDDTLYWMTPEKKGYCISLQNIVTAKRRGYCVTINGRILKDIKLVYED